VSENDSEVPQPFWAVCRRSSLILQGLSRWLCLGLSRAEILHREEVCVRSAKSTEAVLALLVKDLYHAFSFAFLCILGASEIKF